MELQLGNWRPYFEREFEQESFKIFLEKFWEVY